MPPLRSGFKKPLNRSTVQRFKVRQETIKAGFKKPMFSFHILSSSVALNR
jgi:hypothetical protein